MEALPGLTKASSAPDLNRYSVEETSGGGAARQPESCNSFAPKDNTTGVRPRRNRIRNYSDDIDCKPPVEAVDSGEIKSESKNTKHACGMHYRISYTVVVMIYRPFPSCTLLRQ